MNLIDNLIELRILLNNLCDGFSICKESKDMTLTTKIKILFLLEERDCTPGDMIFKLCIAKSNLANILKSMIKENLIISYKNLENSKNIFYRITNLGKQNLKKYKEDLKNNLLSKKNIEFVKLNNVIEQIVNQLKGYKND